MRPYARLPPTLGAQYAATMAAGGKRPDHAEEQVHQAMRRSNDVFGLRRMSVCACVRVPLQCVFSGLLNRSMRVDVSASMIDC